MHSKDCLQLPYGESYNWNFGFRMHCTNSGSADQITRDGYIIDLAKLLKHPPIYRLAGPSSIVEPPSSSFPPSLPHTLPPSLTSSLPPSLLPNPVLTFLTQYGWYILVGVVLTLVAWVKLKPHLLAWSKKRQEWFEEQNFGELSSLSSHWAQRWGCGLRWSLCMVMQFGEEPGMGVVWGVWVESGVKWVWCGWSQQ